MQAGVVEFPDTDGDVHPLFDEIYLFVSQAQVNGQVGIAGLKTR